MADEITESTNETTESTEIVDEIVDNPANDDETSEDIVGIPGFDASEILAAIAELKSMLSSIVLGSTAADDSTTEAEDVSNLQNEYLDDAELAEELQKLEV